MTRIACLMMQKDERLLLRPWLLYHAYMFGFENIYVYDNGSSDQMVLATLQEFASLGVNVDFTRNETGDFQKKGWIIGDKIHEFAKTDAYDMALPLDCDEFVAINGAEGISCKRTAILNEIDRILAGGVICRTSHCLDNRPGYFDLFRYVEHIKSVVLVHKFIDIDHGFHQAGLPPGNQYGCTDLIHIHMHFKPFDQVLESAKDKLAPYVDVSNLDALREFEGVGQHVKGYFFMSPADYYSDLHGYKMPLLRTRILARWIGAMMNFEGIRRVWEAGRPDNLLDHILEIDLDRVPFKPTAYLEANPGLPREVMALFNHFVRAGYQEGRRLEASQAGWDEVVDRFATMRAKKDDGIAGYIGLALPLSRLSQFEEADRLLSDAMRNFGVSAELQREYALLSTFQESWTEASHRWDAFRCSFPENPDGYRFGALVWRRAGNLAEAERIVAEGLSRWPGHLSISIERAIIAGERHDWVRAKELWDVLVRRFPENPEVKANAVGIAYKLRLEQLEATADDQDRAIDAPVLTGTSEAECKAALAFLDLRDVRELRDFFMRFESLGHSCEFGLVQRHYGAEPISLFRWNSIHVPALTVALHARFEGIEDSDNLILSRAGGEYYLRDRKYHTAMHTFTQVFEIDAERFVLQQSKRMGFLRRKLISDLEAGEKIFVHLDDRFRPENEVAALHRAFRRYGPSLLLYVQPAQVPSQVGKVVPVDDGLLFGYIQRLGRGTDGTWNVLFDDWLAICSSTMNYSLTSATMENAG